MISNMDLRYPIGRFERPVSVTAEQRSEWIGILEAAPQRFRPSRG